MEMQMDDPQEWNLEKIRGFLQNDPGSECQAANRQELYGWIQSTLVAQEYVLLKKKERGVIRAFLSRVTRLSPAHLTRLIRQYRRAGTLQTRPTNTPQFSHHLPAGRCDVGGRNRPAASTPDRDG